MRDESALAQNDNRGLNDCNDRAVCSTKRDPIEVVLSVHHGLNDNLVICGYIAHENCRTTLGVVHGGFPWHGYQNRQVAVRECGHCGRIND